MITITTHRSTVTAFLLAAACGLAACAHREAEAVPTAESQAATAAVADTGAADNERAEEAKAQADLNNAHAKAEAERIAAEQQAAKVRADAEAKAEADRADAESRANDEAARVAADAANTKPIEAAPAVVAAPAVTAAAVPGDLVAAAKEAAAALVIPSTYADNGRRLIVQVNRARADGDVVFDKNATTAAVVAAVDATDRFLSGDTLNAGNRPDSFKSIYLALEPESKALGLIPSRKLTDAPALFVNTVVGGDGAAPKYVTVTAIDADSGRVVDTRTRSF